MRDFGLKAGHKAGPTHATARLRSTHRASRDFVPIFLAGQRAGGLFFFWVGKWVKAGQGENACSIDRPLEPSSAACFQASKIVAEKRRAAMQPKVQGEVLALWLETFWMVHAGNGLYFPIFL